MADVEQELQQEQEKRDEEAKRKSRLNQLRQFSVEQAKQQAKQYAKNVAKQAIKKGASQLGKRFAAQGAAQGGAAVAAATSEFWVPALVIIVAILLIVGLILVITTSVAAACQEGGVSGLVARLGSSAASLFIDTDICKQIGVATKGGSGSGGGDFWEPVDLVDLAGVAVDFETSDPRVRSCMLPKVQEIFTKARAAGLEIVITSAYRRGDFPSRHAYGEAVDIALVPVPPKPWAGNAKIAKLVEIGREVGFTPPKGDTLDEYNKPIEGRTTGGHVHVEFNAISEQASHCAPYANYPAPYYP